MPTWANNSISIDKVSLVLAWGFAIFIVLAVVLNIAIRRNVDPIYPVVWQKYSGSDISFEYPTGWTYVKSEKNDITDKIKLETMIFELKGTNCIFTLSVISNIDMAMLSNTQYQESSKNAVFKYEVPKNESPLGYGFEYQNDKIENTFVIIKGLNDDKRGDHNMQRIIERIGQSIRGNR